ncbi:MerR family transcriptional regulator [Desulfobacterota bacterium AH_259_B03_O07]|nr:MerR family transcriptional regulator [Desulfobacterota bacterium AH_259_B03_O07]
MQDDRAEISLPDKIYFRIGEVSEFTVIKPYVLRYWESEFPDIKPIRRKSQRLYDRETIHLILKIKNMLYEQNFTITGAKKKLKEQDNQKRVSTKVNVLLHEVLSELKSIKKLTE